MQTENARLDGLDGQVSIRRAVGSDADSLRRFLAGLSARTAYNRFFTGLGTMPDRLLRWLLGQAGDQEVVLAVHGGEIVGHCMYTALPHRKGVAELAIVVADAWQRHGLGPRLAQALLAAARRHGIREIGFTVLADNRPANRLALRSWPQARPEIDHGVYEYLVLLEDVLAASPAEQVTRPLAVMDAA
jgi:RimJ/RimL family protein N-acetyltransferase